MQASLAGQPARLAPGRAMKNPLKFGIMREFTTT